MSEANGALLPLIAGNWKMNGAAADLTEAALVRDGLEPGGPDVMICPPATLLARLAALAQGSRLAVGAQDCHAAIKGAHTGDISAEMIKDAGGSAVIVGHSERRADHGETDVLVRAKAQAAQKAGLTAIICVGETLGARKAKLTYDVIRRQLAGSVPDGSGSRNAVIAYEPVWAIGTGVTPAPEDVTEAHARIRADLTARFGGEGAAMRILYGGSVNPGNAASLLSLAEVNGALVGGASLKAADFLAIIAARRG